MTQELPGLRIQDIISPEAKTSFQPVPWLLPEHADDAIGEYGCKVFWIDTENGETSVTMELQLFNCPANKSPIMLKLSTTDDFELSQCSQEGLESIPEFMALPNKPRFDEDRLNPFLVIRYDQTKAILVNEVAREDCNLVKVFSITADDYCYARQFSRYQRLNITLNSGQDTSPQIVFD